ncbi:MAG: hypothetical protein LIO46_07900, partial [Clostridiales bacterium]|nr:hypothetical protein [Clostridiales bacterium]
MQAGLLFCGWCFRWHPLTARYMLHRRAAANGDGLMFCGVWGMNNNDANSIANAVVCRFTAGKSSFTAFTADV